MKMTELLPYLCLSDVLSLLRLHYESLEINRFQAIQISLLLTDMSS